MAKPRVFVSSTFYDLKHIRASVEIFIESLGFEPILFEKGEIAFHPDVPLDESCYREAENSDIFVLVIGGRYGSGVSDSVVSRKPTFFEEYKSITEREFDTAQAADVPTFIMIDRAVHAEYYTYLRNKDNKDIKYAHVDSVNVFKLIEAILAKRRNNPVFDFERASDIELLLREQWAGLFKELLRTRSQQRQLSALNVQVSELQSVNETLKSYLEVMLNNVVGDKSAALIANEDQKLSRDRELSHLRVNPFFRYLVRTLSLTEDDAADFILKSRTAEEAVRKFKDFILQAGRSGNLLSNSAAVQSDFNAARISLGKAPLDFVVETKTTSDLIDAMKEERVLRRKNAMRESGKKNEE